MNIQAWLRELGMAQYVDAFHANDVDADVLRELDESDLEKLGVSSLGHRKKILRAIDSLNDSAVASSDSPGSAVSVPPTDGGEAERRHLSVMFCDLVGSTELSATYDPEDLADIVRAYQDACAGVVSRYEGYIARYMGDGMLVYFGYPQAHEDDAERALRAGLEIIERIGRITPRPGLAMQTRVGIASGLVVVGETVGEQSSREQVVLGETPNLAARLQGIAEPDQLVIADDTKRLCGEVFEYCGLGQQSLKGFGDPVVAHIVTGERATESRFAARSSRVLLPLVGREQEISLLLERWRLARGGEGQLVLLTGEAGIGKSRITRALIDALADEEHYRINYQCSPYHTDSTLYPAIQQLRLASKYLAGEDAGTRFGNLDALLERAGSVSTEQSALLANLMGLDGEAHFGNLDLTPQQRRTRTLLALRDQLVGLSAQRPVLFILEDAHWIDPTTLELLDILLDSIDARRVLMLVTARPTFGHGFGGHPIVTRLMLNRLGRDHVGTIVARLTDGKTLPDELLDEITAKTDGVPLFVEELTKTILESGLLRELETSFELCEPLSELSIPITLHDSLMARLDRLQPVKEVAQTAACIGREFDHVLLSGISPLPESELNAALDKLIEAELVYRRGADRDAVYQFKHALVRDAAYESLLKSKRRQIHTRLVETLEAAELMPPELIAHHATRAGLNEKAVDYWQQAGELAIARPAYKEAIGHLSNAIELTNEWADDRNWRERELKLQIALGQALIASQGYAAQPTVDAFQRALALADGLGNTLLRIPALYGEWAASYIRGVPFTDLVLRFADAANEADDTGPRVVALRMQALEQLHHGEFSEANALVEKALALYEPDSHRHLGLEFAHDPRSASLNYRCWALWHLGFSEQAQMAGRQGLEWAHELNHANTIGIARCWGVVLANVLLRNTAQVSEEARALIEYSNEMAMPLWRAWSRIFLGWAQVLGDEAPNGMQELDAGLAEAEQIGARRLRPLTLCLSAEARTFAGDTGAAAAAIAEAFDEQERSEDLAWTTHLYRVRANVLLGGEVPQAEQAEADFLKSIEIARRQEAKLPELRAATDLARLWSGRGEGSKAGDLLHPVYDWFTEGFETADLREAKQLLSEM